MASASEPGVLPQSVKERLESYPSPDEDLPSGLDGPFFKELGKRKKQNRDAKILVTADHGQTGVGKSNLCDFLGYVTDTSPGGFSEEKTTIDPQEFIEMYNTLEPGSACIMEEGEQFDSRRSMSNKNVDASHIWQQARVREITAFVNLPSPSMIDKRFEELADYWINVERRGRATVYRKKIHRTKQSIYYKTLQRLEWPNMDGSRTFRHMGQLKDSMLNDEDAENNWVRKSEVKKQIERATSDIETDQREKWIKALKEHGMTGADIAGLSCVDVSPTRVNQIARGD